MLNQCCHCFEKCTDKLKDLPPLIFRAILVYGFYGPAKTKLANIGAVAEWFGQIGIPLPTLNAYMAVTTEISGVILLTLGLATRLISIPMMFVMLVAIKTVHLKNGFSCGENGFEVPFYYLCMLFYLMINGPGRISVDHFMRGKWPCCKKN